MRRLSTTLRMKLFFSLGLYLFCTGCPQETPEEQKAPPEPEVVKPWCDPEALTTTFTALVETLRREGDPSSPGMAVALIFEKNVDYDIVEFAVGLSNLENPTYMISKDTFQMGEITETFIAAGLLYLQEQEKISLDDSLSMHLDESVYGSLGPVAQLTLRQLALHDTDLVGYYDANMPEDPTPQERISFFRMGADGAPAEGIVDVRLDYVLLSKVIERVAQLGSWRSLGTWLTANVGLVSMGKTVFPTSEQYTVVKGYSATPGVIEQVLHDIDKPGSYYWGDRNLVSNVTEMAEWFYWVNIGEDVLSIASRDEMFSFEDGIGLGSRSYELDTKMPGELRGMHGSLPGYATMIGYWPEAKVSLAIAINQTGILQVQDVFEKTITLFLDNSDCRQLPY